MLNQTTQNPGYIYALANPYMPGLVKIGRTTRDPKQRAKELCGTGVPGAFDLLYAWETPDCIGDEKFIHEELSHYRLQDNREFFQVAPEQALAFIEREIELLRLADNVDRMEPPEFEFGGWESLEKEREHQEREEWCYEFTSQALLEECASWTGECMGRQAELGDAQYNQRTTEAA